MRKVLLGVLAVVLVAIGVVWTLQGYDVLGGSPMSGESVWGVVGPAVAGFGVALGFVVVRGPR